MISRLILALVVAIVVGLGCILLGGILGSLHIPIAETVGSFLERYAWVIGILAGLAHFFGGGSFGRLG